MRCNHEILPLLLIIALLYYKEFLQRETRIYFVTSNRVFKEFFQLIDLLAVWDEQL
jgi:hypothetical protein